MKARWLSCKNCFLRPNDLKWWESAELFTLIPDLSVGVAREWTGSRLKIAHYEQNTGEFNEFDEFKASLGFAMSGMTDLCILSMNTAKTHTNHTLTWHHSVKEPQQTAAILTRPGLEPWRQVLQVHRGSTPSLFWGAWKNTWKCAIYNRVVSQAMHPKKRCIKPIHLLKPFDALAGLAAEEWECAKSCREFRRCAPHAVFPWTRALKDAPNFGTQT